jgi:hypothetical protein
MDHTISDRKAETSSTDEETQFDEERIAFENRAFDFRTIMAIVVSSENIMENLCTHYLVPSSNI